MTTKRGNIAIGSKDAQNVSFTMEFFDSGQIVNKLPYGLYITRIEPKNEQSIKQMLKGIKEHGYLANITKLRIGLEWANKIIEEAGYKLVVDPAGKEEYVNYITKKNEQGKRIICRL